MRYVITAPGPENAWWRVVDTCSSKGPAFAVATFFRDAPYASAIARQYCEILNQGADVPNVTVPA